MNDKDAIIKKIIDKANDKAKEITNEALEEKTQILKKAKEEAKEYRNEKLPNYQLLVDELVERGRVLSNLEAKKIILAKKKTLIDEVFKLAVQDFKTKVDQKNYIKLIEGMIKKHAENLDEVQFSASDKDLFDDKFLQAIAKKQKIELKMSKTYGSFAGGVLITNKFCDKNLTLEIELEEIKSIYESQIAKEVFGEK